MAFRSFAAENPAPNPRVIPAQVNFLTIYNPTLGDTEETENDQVVFWIDKDELGGNRTGRKSSKSADGRDRDGGSKAKQKSEEQAMNERLRQIGLARGMADFARNFANDQPLDTIETDRSRIVLYELEKDWWILASVDLTRLPPAQTSTDGPKEPQAQFEFSAREVSPSVLLRAQLTKAHNLFLMHHAANLWELYSRLGRTTFCALLNRFWEDFAKKWDVLLHGNPAVDVYGDCIKLAGGGELGVGVGEEEWGSGEREVLEGFLDRAEGLVECVVGRYGAAPPDKSKKKSDGDKRKRLAPADKTETDEMPWLGAGEDPGPADGIIFSGVGIVSKRTLATVSQWMEAIFKHGDSAYGIGQNPASRPRQRRQRPKIERQVSDDPPRKSQDEDQSGTETHPRLKSPKSKAPDLRRQAIENNAIPSGLSPGIPAPLVGAVERSLDQAVTKAAQRSSSKSPRSSPTQEKSEDEAMNGSSSSKEEESSYFSMEGMKNMLSFGYGSSWTLSSNGFDKKDETASKAETKSQTEQGSNASSKSGGRLPAGPLNTRPRLERSQSSDKSADTPSQDDLSGDGRPPLLRSISGSKTAPERLQEIDPNPEISEDDIPFVQKLEQSSGKFLIGLSGDLENMEFEDPDEPTSLADTNRKSRGQRIFLRTLTIELANTQYLRPSLQRNQRKSSQTSNLSKASVGSAGSTNSSGRPEPKTSAAASVDGANPARRYEKVQVAVYVNQPFIFVFLFELHNAKLTMPGFYRTIHHSLGPLQIPLLRRTDPTRVVERIAATLNEKASAAVSAVRKHVDNNGNAIYDLVYDTTKNTIRTSIPNIPIPASPNAAISTPATVSGAWYTLGIPIGTSSSASTARPDPAIAKARAELWSRIEALNVHTQMLHTFSATRPMNELERTVKTARGWWVLWMKISAPGKEVEELKEAFLVRKSADYSASRQNRDASKSSGSAAGRWLLRDQGRSTSNAGNFSGDGGARTGAKSVSEGVGIDAKKWVEGLLSLTQ